MASDNVELVRSIFERWARGDFRDASWAHPEIEFVAVDGPTPGTWSGIAEMGVMWRETLEAWDDFRAAAEEIRELDKERVLVLTENTGRGRASGLDLGGMETRGANLFHVRDGKVTRLATYWVRDRLLAELGR